MPNGNHDSEKTTPTTTAAVVVPKAAAAPVPDYKPGPRITQVEGPYYWVKMEIPKSANKEQLDIFGSSALSRQWTHPPTATEMETRNRQPKWRKWRSKVITYGYDTLDWSF